MEKQMSFYTENVVHMTAEWAIAHQAAVLKPSRENLDRLTMAENAVSLAQSSAAHAMRTYLGLLRKRGQI